MIKLMILLLGCHIYDILLNRIHYSIQYINKLDLNNTEITWYLAGGNKFISHQNHQINNLILNSEAYKIKNILDSIAYPSYKWNYILEYNSTNTAENLLYFNYWLCHNDFYDDIFIITSNFHHKRTNKIIHKLNFNNKIKWILSDKSNIDFDYWEKIHFDNIDNDLIVAHNKIYTHNISWFYC